MGGNTRQARTTTNQVALLVSWFIVGLTARRRSLFATETTPWAPRFLQCAPGPQAENVVNRVHHLLSLLVEALLHVEQPAPSQHYGLGESLAPVGPAP